MFTFLIKAGKCCNWEAKHHVYFRVSKHSLRAYLQLWQKKDSFLFHMALSHKNTSAHHLPGECWLRVKKRKAASGKIQVVSNRPLYDKRFYRSRTDGRGFERSHGMDTCSQSEIPKEIQILRCPKETPGPQILTHPINIYWKSLGSLQTLGQRKENKAIVILLTSGFKILQKLQEAQEDPTT